MDEQEGIHNMYPPTRRARAGKIQIDCYITMDDQVTVNLYLTCPSLSCWRIHIMYTFLVIHCYITVNGKIQIDCYITMDDQEGIQNMYPPTRRARAGKIQIDCYITMDDQEGIQNIVI
jgi:hypothetical protein